MQVLSSQGEQTNAIAAAMQNGELDVLTLWAAVRGYAYRKARRWAAALEHRSGQDVEDLMQEAFLALLRAVGLWEQYKGMGFIGVYELTLRDGFSRACGCRTKREAEDPLRAALSLDMPVGEDGEEAGTLGALVPDESAECPFLGIEQQELADAVHDRRFLVRQAGRRKASHSRPESAQTSNDQPGVKNILLTEKGKKDRKCPIERGNYHRHQKTAGTGCAFEQSDKGSCRPQGWNQRKDAAAVLAGRGIFDRLQTGCRRNGGRCNAPASAKSFECGHTAANDRIEQSRGNRKSDYGGTDAAGIQPEILRVQRHSETFGGTRCTMTDSGRVCWRRCVPRLPGLRLYFRTERALGWRSIRIRLKQLSFGHRSWQHYTFAGTHRSRHQLSSSTYRKERLHEHQRKH